MFRVMELFCTVELWWQIHTSMNLFKPIEPYTTMSEVYWMQIKKIKNLKNPVNPGWNADHDK